MLLQDSLQTYMGLQCIGELNVFTSIHKIMHQILNWNKGKLHHIKMITMIPFMQRIPITHWWIGKNDFSVINWNKGSYMYQVQDKGSKNTSSKIDISYIKYTIGMLLSNYTNLYSIIPLSICWNLPSFSLNCIYKMVCVQAFYSQDCACPRFWYIILIEHFYKISP